MDRTRTWNIPLITLLVVAFVALVAVGCNSGTEEPDAPKPDPIPGGPAPGGSDGAGVKADEIDPSRLPEELAEGMIAGVPELYPSDLPVYPGAVAAQGKSASRDGSDMAAVQFLSNDDPADAYAAYVRDLESKGWTADPESTPRDGNSIEVIKGDCKATVLFAPATGGSGTDIFAISECKGS